MSGAISSVVVILAAKAVVAGVGLTAAALADSLKRPKVTGNDQLSRTVQHNRDSIDAGMLRFSRELAEFERSVRRSGGSQTDISRFRDSMKSLERYRDSLATMRTDSISPQEAHALFDDYRDRMHELGESISEIQQENLKIRQEREKLLGQVHAAEEQIKSGLAVLKADQNFISELCTAYDIEQPLTADYSDLAAGLNELSGGVGDDEIPVLKDRLEKLAKLSAEADERRERFEDCKNRILEQVSSLQSSSVLDRARVLEQKRELEVRSEQLRIENEKLLEKQQAEALLREQIDLSLRVFAECRLYACSDETLAGIDVMTEDVRKIDSAEYARNYYQTVALPFLKKCRQEKQHSDQIADDFNLLEPQYRVLCETFGDEFQEFARTADGLAQLKEEIKKLEIRFENVLAVDYVNRIIDDTMRELGYETIGDRSHTNRGGQLVSQKLVKFSDTSSLHFTVTENGQMSMEVVGTDSTDRRPTEEERDSLTAEMKKLCGRFPKIKEVLARRGLDIDQTAILPADRQFAKIINTSSFNMREQKEARQGMVQTEQQKYLQADDGQS